MRRFEFLALAVAAIATPARPAVAQPEARMPGRTITLRTGVSLKVVAKPVAGTSFTLPAPRNDPRGTGGALRILDTGNPPNVLELGLAVQPAPLGWKQLGTDARPRGYRYRAAGTAADPCSVQVKPTTVKIACKGTGVTLTPPFVGEAGVVLELGTGPARYCAAFGGQSIENVAGRLRRKSAPPPGACPTTTIPSTTTTTTLPDADQDGVPDALDRCPGGNDGLDLDREGTPDPCQELAVRASIDDFEGYSSDAALATAWTAWGAGADVTITRGLQQGEGQSAAMRLVPLGADPATGSTWASVSRPLTGPTPGAFDGLVFYVRHTGTNGTSLGVNLTEANGEPWTAVQGAVALLPDGGPWETRTADANGVVSLPAGFHGLVRIRFAALEVPVWYAGPGDGTLDTAALARVDIGLGVAGHLGDPLVIDALAWWYAVDAAIAGKVHGRTFPSIYQPWNGIDDEPTVPATDLIARHDLLWRTPQAFGFAWSPTTLSEPCTPDPGGSCIGLAVAFVPSTLGPGAATLAAFRARNPNQLLLAEIRYRDAGSSYLPAAHRFWQHDAQGNRIIGWAEGNYYLLDWHQAEYRAVVAAQAAAAVQAGFDGIMLDWWDDTDDDRIDLIRRVRTAVGSHAVIVNSNDRQALRAAPFINGLYMEGYQSTTAQHWAQLGSTLAWADAAVRIPRVTAIETWYATGRTDLDRMRATTTLALTRSDGYALFCDPNDLPVPDHLHSWYAFWNEPLGIPLAPGALQANGAWRREFSGGTVLYNPMGNATVTVTFATPHRSAATGVVGTSHDVASRDGDLFLP